MNTKVYLSSTFKDLIPYRLAAIEALMTVDFKHVEGMEFYSARFTSTLQSCLDDVRKADLYILLIGKMYGSIASEEDLLGLSYTHHEFLAARTSGKKILIFEARDDLRYPPLKAMTDQEAQVNEINLAKFKHDIWGNSVAPGPLKGYFSSELELKDRIITSLVKEYKLLKVGKRYLPGYSTSYLDRTVEEIDHWISANEEPEGFKVFEFRAPKEAATPELIKRFICNFISPDRFERLKELNLNSMFSQSVEYKKVRMKILNEINNFYGAGIEFKFLADSQKFFDRLTLALKGEPIIVRIGYNCEHLRESQKNMLDRIFEDFNSVYHKNPELKVYFFVDVIVEAHHVLEKPNSPYHFVTDNLGLVEVDSDFCDWFCRKVKNDKILFYRVQKLNYLTSKHREVSMMEAILILDKFIQAYNQSPQEENLILTNLLENHDF